MNSKEIFTDIISFATRHGLDPANLILQIADKPNHVEQVVAAANATAVADATVIRAEQPAEEEPAEEPYPLPNNAFALARRWWRAQAPGFRANSREIYKAAGLIMPKKSRALTEWLIRSRTARYDGSHRGLYVFTRTWQEDDDN